MRRLVALNCTLVCFLSLSVSCKKKPQPIARAPVPPPVSADKPAPATVSSPTVEISAAPSTIERGQQTELSWNSSHATSLIIDSGVGNMAESGSLIISPRESTTYTATATGARGEAKASTRVTVVDRIGSGVIGVTDIHGLEQAIREGKVQPLFFSYDKADLSSEAKLLLEANAHSFREFPEAKVVIEGHCDERGTEEYNLALGDRRSQAAMDYLLQLGVDPKQLKPISFGEERPFATCHDESCWRQNRRAHFRVQR